MTLDDLWNSAPAGRRAFDPTLLPSIPHQARRYLQHAIAPGTPLAIAVRLKMHGEIKLKGWLPFHAEQVICWNRGMIWRAAVRMHGIAIRGADTYLDGKGAMRWRLFGIVPVVNASGPDITRSAAGRVNIESMWLPSVLLNDETSWTALDNSHFHARFTAHDETAEIDYVTDEKGGLQSVNMPRWGNPGGAEFHLARFGGFVEQEVTFAGYTIPSRMRAGWHFGAERFEPEGEFFRVTIDDAVYR
jgi:hypothetical protein